MGEQIQNVPVFGHRGLQCTGGACSVGKAALMDQRAYPSNLEFY